VRRIYLHPLPVRIWHWINAVACVILFLTGIQLRYVGTVNVISFRTAVGIHNWSGFVVIASFFLWLGFYLCSDRITVYHTEPDPKKFFLDTLRQAMFYGTGIFKRAADPFRVSIHHKFNPLQSMTYQVVMLIVLPVQIATGLLLWNLVGFAGIVGLLGGVRVVDTIHVLGFIFFAFYLPAHAYLGTLGRTPLQQYKEMFTGYAKAEEAEKPDVPD
jgi:thiosulfate reductase cytochrome b subunit